MTSISYRSLEKILVIAFIVISNNLSFGQNAIDEDVFRVMTYNIRYTGNEETDGVNAWSNRKELVASMIRFHHSDIVGITRGSPSPA